jgi:hypothetical protein
MDYRKATDQQLMVIVNTEVRATLLERAEAQAELWRRTRPQWERVQVKIRRRG